jgi:formylglycine-generating enzyme required for sulfatase activity
MSAIFISYTGRDPEGDVWADRLAEWCREWNYGFFRDKDHSHGIKAGADWRASLYRQLGLAQALISLCTKQYESSPWCVGEVAIAVEKGKTVIPIHLGNTREQLKEQPLPLLLQDRQAIQFFPASAPSAEQLAEVKLRLQQTLEEKLNWRALQPWDGSLKPYPGLPAFQASQAPVFFGRDGAIDSVCERLASLALRPKAFLLLLGASGTGKSSLVRAGVVPKLRGERERRWLVLEPFKPGLDPFAALRGVLMEPLAEAVLLPTKQQSSGEEAAELMHELHSLSSRRQVTVLMVIDQFEELLSDQRQPGMEPAEGERFLEFLEALLQLPTAGVMVLATMRTDFLDPLQTHWPDLLGLATPEPVQTIRPEDFGQLIIGPAARSGLTLQPGLAERLVAESGGRDALPLLAFTLEKLWRKRQKRGVQKVNQSGESWDLTVADYEALGGVAGAVSHQATICWNPANSAAEDTTALRQDFLDHLLTLNDKGEPTKRPALLADLHPRSRPIIQRLVDDRLLVSDAGVVEIAHEALLRTWKPLVGWIQEGKEELEQRHRVVRLVGDLSLNKPVQARLAALQGLLILAEKDPQSVAIAEDCLASVLTQTDHDPREWPLAIRLLALLGGKASMSALSWFLENRQIREAVETERAAPVLEALCQAAASLQDISCLPCPGGDDEVRWLLLTSAKVSDDGKMVSTQIVQLRFWAMPRLETPGVWCENLGNGVNLTMVSIPAGSFSMGSPQEETGRSDDEGPQHLVSLESYWMSQTPITQAQWRHVMLNNPSQFQRRDDRDQVPVEQVSWNDALLFCDKLCERTGRYYVLPTEAQWEYACRAGTTSPFHFGGTVISELANINANRTYGNASQGAYRAQTSAVRLFPANDWGLHDMHGNVLEWCMDQWHPSYKGAPNNGKAWLMTGSENGTDKRTGRLLRGGSWDFAPGYCRSASRDHSRPGGTDYFVGFRVVCLPKSSK